MRQGGAPPTGKWIGSPLGGVKAPDALILPNPTTRFAAHGGPARGLVAPGIRWQEWLRFMAELARAQHAAATTLEPFADPAQAGRSTARWPRGCRRSLRTGIAETRLGAMVSPCMLAALRRGSLPAPRSDCDAMRCVVATTTARSRALADDFSWRQRQPR